MKNIKIAVDDETYLAARIAAAEKGTSVSAMVKRFLQEQGESRRSEGMREMTMTYTAQPLSTPAAEEPLPPGAMRGMLGWTEDFDTWPDGFLEAKAEGAMLMTSDDNMRLYGVPCIDTD